MRRDLVKKTQDAINKASISVNQSLNDAKKARHKVFKQKKHQTNKVRQEWQQDATLAKTLYTQMEQNRREILNMERQISSQNSREKGRRQIMYRRNYIQDVDKESQFKSAVFREHQQTLREEAERRRRASVAARAKLRANHRKGAQELRMQSIEEEQAILEERYAASIAIRNTNKMLADQRRDSLANRNAYAAKQRQEDVQRQAEAFQNQHESYELKWQAEKDAEEYRRQCEQARRESLAARNDAARKAREIQEEQHLEEWVAEHESFELKRLADKDVEEYKKRMAEERRQSLANRNAKGFQDLQNAEQRKTEALLAEHVSYELKWDGERDAEAYKQHLEQLRRESLAGRNLKARQDRELMSKQKQEELCQRQASVELRLAAERDADAYRSKLEQERRDSLQFRNKEGLRQRNLECQENAENLAAEHASYELKWAGEKDAEEYQRKMEEERRQSLAKRNKEARQQREIASQKMFDAMSKEHESYELKWAGEKDAEEYHRKLEQERRESLAMRNRERARHAKVMEELRVLAREQETESLVLKWAGEADAKAYLKKIEDERRQSQQFRGAENVRHRKLESEWKDMELASRHQDEELHSADQKDVEEYRKQCAERDRLSLEYRRKEAHKQRLEEEERLAQQAQQDAASFQLESLARSDVEEYLADCRCRRRMSLALRAKEKRRHAKWKANHDFQEVQRHSRDVRDRLLDQQYIELARQQERAKNAMIAIKHAGCSFNPFSGVL